MRDIIQESKIHANGLAGRYLQGFQKANLIVDELCHVQPKGWQGVNHII